MNFNVEVMSSIVNKASKELKMSSIVNKASEELKSKTLGGVTKESAFEAIQHGVSDALTEGEKAVEKAVKAGQEAVGKIQKELAEFKNKSAKEMAELTSKKDELILKAKATKSFEKTLPNGNKEIRKVNKNGAVMVREVTPDGKNVKTSVTTLEGDYRKTTFNPLTGKPAKSYTNINGDKLIQYDADGKAVSQKAVNVIKTKPQKPTLISETPVKEINNNWAGDKGISFERLYSDGSKESIFAMKNNDGRIYHEGLTKYNSEGTPVKRVISHPLVDTKTTTYFKDNGKKQTILENGAGNNRYKHVTEEIYDKKTGSDVVTKGTLENNTQTIKYKALKDDFGIYSGEYELKVIPKDKSCPVETKIVIKKELDNFLKQ